MSVKDGVSANLRKLAQESSSVFAGALFRRAEAVMTRSKTEFVPVDQGVLRSTGHVKPPEVNGQDISVTMGYGGPAAPYAIVQHERLDFQHPVGQAKYLERPVVDAQRTLAADIANDPDVRALLK